MSGLNKIKWILGITLVFLLILTTNLIDRHNFTVVRDSIEAIYADRLVAQDILIDLAKVVWRKEVAYSNPDMPAAPRDHAEIDAAIDLFLETRLTRQEDVAFTQLRAALQELKETETALASGNADRQAILAAIAPVKEQLDELFEIQLAEGRRKLFEGSKAISSADLFTQLEIGALVILAIAVQVIILYTPKLDDSGDGMV